MTSERLGETVEILKKHQEIYDWAADFDILADCRCRVLHHRLCDGLDYLKGMVYMAKCYNGIMGLIVGDALGVPAEFKPRDTFRITDMTGFGTYNQPPGTWSDDSSMTLATIAGIVLRNGVFPNEIMRNFKLWLACAVFTPRGEVFDVGGATRRAIDRYIYGDAPQNCGGKTRLDNGNGALMRILPIALFTSKPSYFSKSAFDLTTSLLFSEITNTILSVAHLTHAHWISDYACLIYSEIVRNLMNGAEKEKAVANGIERYIEQINAIGGLAEYGRLAHIRDCSRDEIRSSGYVVDTLEAALWCFLTTDSYRECVLAAVNLGEDTDTVAAVAGGLAGIYYGGENGIPAEWISQIARKRWIDNLCVRFEQMIER